jgi:hypothetical protein
MKMIDPSILARLQEKSTGLSPAFIKENFNELVLLSMRSQFQAETNGLPLKPIGLASEPAGNKGMLLSESLQLEIDHIMQLTQKLRAELLAELERQRRG